MANQWVVGVGANVGTTAAAFDIARELIAERVGRVVATSPAYRTAPQGPAQPDYRNAALRIESELGPLRVLEGLMEVERALGRDRAVEERWGPRTMDLDVLHGFGVTAREDRLTVPHPRLTERAFALVPLLDVAPELADSLGPALGRLSADVRSLRPAPTVSTRTLGDGAEAVARDPLEAIAAVVRGACRRDEPLRIDAVDAITLGAPMVSAVPTMLRAALAESRLTGVHLSRQVDGGVRARLFTAPRAARLSALELYSHGERWRAIAKAAPD